MVALLSDNHLNARGAVITIFFQLLEKEEHKGDL
jgi:hypothetical protein